MLRPVVAVYKAPSRIDAQALVGFLRQEGIAAQARSYRDSAFGSIFQVQNGWGVVEVPSESLELAQELVKEWLASTSEQKN